MVLRDGQFFTIRNGVLIPASIPFPRWAALASGLPGPVGIVPTIQPVVVLEDPVTLDRVAQAGAGAAGERAAVLNQILSTNTTMVTNVVNNAPAVEQALALMEHIELWRVHIYVGVIRTTALAASSGTVFFDITGDSTGNSAIRGPGYIIDATLKIDSNGQAAADGFIPVIELDGFDADLTSVADIRGTNGVLTTANPTRQGTPGLPALLERDTALFVNAVQYMFASPLNYGQIFFRKIRFGGRTSADVQSTTGTWRYGLLLPSVRTLEQDFSLVVGL